MIILDFNIIDTHNNLTLAIADVSSYDNTVISNASLEIIPPGYTKVTLPFYPKNMNTYNSNDVGITCIGEQHIDLPDGLWQLTYSIYPNSINYINYYFMRTNIIQCRLDNTLLSLLNTPKDLDFVKKERMILDIQILIDGSVAAANRLDTSFATNLYHKASNMITKLTIDKCSSCGNL